MFTFNLPKVTEIAPDVFRFCLYAPEINLQFNFFLIRDTSRSCSLPVIGPVSRCCARRLHE